MLLSFYMEKAISSHSGRVLSGGFSVRGAVPLLAVFWYFPRYEGPEAGCKVVFPGVCLDKYPPSGQTPFISLWQ